MALSWKLKQESTCAVERDLPLSVEYVQLHIVFVFYVFVSWKPDSPSVVLCVVVCMQIEAAIVATTQLNSTQSWVGLIFLL